MSSYDCNIILRTVIISLITRIHMYMYTGNFYNTCIKLYTYQITVVNKNCPIEIFLMGVLKFTIWKLKFCIYIHSVNSKFTKTAVTIGAGLMQVISPHPPPPPQKGGGPLICTLTKDRNSVLLYWIYSYLKKLDCLHKTFYCSCMSRKAFFHANLCLTY